MEINDIYSLSTAMASSKNLTQVGMAVLGMQLDSYTDTGKDMVASLDSMPSQSLESMVNPSIGQNIDIMV